MQLDEMPAFHLILSNERLKKYIGHSGPYKDFNMIDLYKWNTLLCESLYPSLQTIEVAFRNATNHAIISSFGNKDWLLNLELLKPSEQIRVREAKAYLIKNKKNPTIDRLVAELSFGFWTSLLDARYEHHLWRYIIKKVFPNMQKTIRTRKNVSRRFDIIRKLRNRIFHYEPIWHLTDLKDHHLKIIEAIQWIDHGAIRLIEDIDRFNVIFMNGPKKMYQIKTSDKEISVPYRKILAEVSLLSELDNIGKQE